MEKASNGLFCSTDKKLIEHFITFKAEIVKTEKDSRNRTIFFFKETEIRDLLALWRSGKPIMVEIRSVFEAEEIFNMRVHEG